ncbi:MAG: metallophosphoesterase family protein [Phycisphaeraceae bacterium]
MRTLVIGDIHGCLRALDALLDAVQPSSEDQLITLGDYVDCGPDSRGVIDRMIGLAKSHNLVALLGNHEEMMLESLFDMNNLRAWCMCGGDHTLRSYVGRGGVPFSVALKEVPEEHWHFLQFGCRDWHETDTHIFVHGYVDPFTPMPVQQSSVLRWQKFHDPQPHISGKVIICGHTAQREGNPVNVGHAICIDTCCYGGGWLTCLHVESGRYWQANQKGELRVGNIAEHEGEVTEGEVTE